MRLSEAGEEMEEMEVGDDWTIARLEWGLLRKHGHATPGIPSERPGTTLDQRNLQYGNDPLECQKKYEECLRGQYMDVSEYSGREGMARILG